MNMPTVCPRSVPKIDKICMLFRYDYFQLILQLSSVVPPTVLKIFSPHKAALVKTLTQFTQLQLCEMRYQMRYQKFICISHQELSFRYTIPSDFVTAALISCST